MMEISNTGIDLIAKFEGLKTKAYLCPAGVWTIGLGTTSINGIPVKRGQTCTIEEAYQYCRDYIKTSIYPCFDIVHVELNQNQFDALCSFIYNIGSGAFKKSTLLKKLNEGDFSGAADEFLQWNKIKGKISKGLTLRRNAERELFLS